MTQRDEILLAFVCGATVGGVVVAAALNQKYKTKYAQIADDEIEQVKDHYRMKEMDLLETQKEIASQKKPSLETMTRHLTDKAKAELISEGEGYTPVTQEDIEELQEREEAEEEERNAFVELPGWNYDEQVASRTPDKPFIMHAHEYMQSECSHQITITYFEGDDVLVDESDEVISKKDEVVGMDNLERFGFGSGDPNTLYVRNPKLDIEYEILRHRGHYAKEILGLEEDPSLEHSAIPRRHMKFDDGTT